MTRHSFDALTAAFGLIAVALGVLVMFGRIDSLAGDVGIWLPVIALLIGVALIPWTGRHRDSAER